MIFFLRTPLAVVEEHNGDADLFARTRQQFVQADTPRAVTDVGDRRPVGRCHLGTARNRERIAAIAKTHCRQHRARLFETQIRVRYRADVADVGRDHRPLRHRALELAQHLARMHVAGVFRDLDRVGIGFVGPLVELGLPRRLFCFDLGGALCLVLLAGESFSLQASQQRDRGRLGVAADADRDRFDQAQHLGVGVDLDDLRVLGPVVQSVLRQCAEGA